MLLFGCKKSNEPQQVLNLKGDYSGTFSRINHETGWNCITGVTLSFTDSTFSGTNEQHYFPAICEGNFEIEEYKIIFQNTCVWPAHFDWSLILSREWNYEFNENQLKIWKERGNIEDEYLLKKD